MKGRMLNISRLWQKISAVFAVASVVALAAAPVVVAKVVYPIHELGNCRDGQECFYYCEIPAHYDACTQYSQLHFLGQVLGDSTTASPAPYSFPIKELGNCASPAECSNFCSKTENRTTCVNFFSQRAGTQSTPSTGQTPPTPQGAPTQTGTSVTTPPIKINQQFLLDAKAALGCDSYQSCSAFCNQVANHQACEDFAKSERAKGVSPTAGSPTPSSTPQPSLPPITSFQIDCSKAENASKCAYMGNVCGSFCRLYPRSCQSRVPTSSPLPRSTTTQPQLGTLPPQLSRLSEVSGCKTTQECSQYCQAHPGVCPALIGGGTTTVSPTATPLSSPVTTPTGTEQTAP